MNELSPAVAAPELGANAALGRRPPPLHRHRADGLLDRRRPLRHPGYSPLARQALRRRPRRHGICRQREHHGHGGVGPCRRLFQPRDRSEKGHPAQPRPTRDPDHAARSCARPHHLHPASRDAGALHGGRLHSHPCLSRRALQRRRLGERVCRLHHRQRRQQPHRAPDLGGRRRPFRHRRQFLLLRLAQSARRRARLFHRREGAADEGHGRRHELAFRGVDHASQESVPARELRHRLLHPVRVHRHLHLS